MRKYSQRSLDNLAGIHPDLRRVVDRALQDAPIDFVVIDGVRTQEEQRALVAKGVSRTLNSRHLTGHAVDLWPIDPLTGRGADGENDKRLWELYRLLAPAVMEAAEAEGVALVWGGNWTRFRDGPHFELERHAYPAIGDIPNPLTQSRTVAGGAVAAAAGVAEIGRGMIEPLAEAQATLEPLSHGSELVRAIFLAVMLAGVALTLYARWDDSRRGAR